GRSFGSYLAATIMHRPFHTGVIWQTGNLAGQEVNYWDLEGYTALTDSGIFLFGFVIALEGIVLATVVSQIRAKRPLVSMALVLTVLVSLYNLYAAIKIF